MDTGDRLESNRAPLATLPRHLELTPEAERLLSHLEWERPHERFRGAPGLPTQDLQVLAQLRRHVDQFAATLAPEERASLEQLLARASADDALPALAATPAEEILDAQELALFRQLQAEPVPAESALHSSVHLIVKVTRWCNLRCTYCNYWREDPTPMSFPVLARMTHAVLRDPGVREAKFLWHGGESTMLSFDFYRKWLWLQEQFRRPDQLVRNRVQTNATILTDKWLQFIKDYRLIVGVSLDGPPEINDKRRVNHAGEGTSHKVRAGIERLYAAGIEPRVNMVVDQDVIDCGAERILEYFLEAGITRVGLLNVVPENTAPGEPLKNTYVPFPRFVAFMRDFFALWWPNHVDRIVPREIADLVRQSVGRSPLICNFAGRCFGVVYTVEPNGDVWCACDRYVGSDRSLLYGNLLSRPLGRVEASGWYRDVVDSNEKLVDRRRECRWFSVCHGGCPHDYKMATQWQQGFDGRCCGLGPLLDDIDAALRAVGVDPAAARPPAGAADASIVMA
jgi:uncharacterized protein